MKKNLIVILVLSAAFIACSKNSYETKPQIKVKSTNGNVIPAIGDAVLSTTFEFTDKEGDLGKGELVYYLELLNKRSLVNPGSKYQPISVPVPEFPDKSKGEMELRLQRSNIYLDIVAPPNQDKNDTIIVRAVVKDRAGNVSDTARTEPIVLLGQ